MHRLATISIVPNRRARNHRTKRTAKARTTRGPNNRASRRDVAQRDVARTIHRRGAQSDGQTRSHTRPLPSRRWRGWQARCKILTAQGALSFRSTFMASDSASNWTLRCNKLRSRPAAEVGRGYEVHLLNCSCTAVQVHDGCAPMYRPDVLYSRSISSSTAGL